MELAEYEAAEEKFCRRREILNKIFEKQEEVDFRNQLIARKDAFDVSKVEFDLECAWHGKTKKAIWSSTFIDGTSDWCEQRIQVGYAPAPRFFVCRVHKDARVLTIRNAEEAKKVPVVRPTDYTELIDFKALADAGYDGLHTLWWTQYFSIFDGWDCESTVWFTTRWIESVEEVHLPDIFRRAEAFQEATR